MMKKAVISTIYPLKVHRTLIAPWYP